MNNIRLYVKDIHFITIRLLQHTLQACPLTNSQEFLDESRMVILIIPKGLKILKKNLSFITLDKYVCSRRIISTLYQLILHFKMKRYVAWCISILS